jgi:hypothetical protein
MAFTDSNFVIPISGYWLVVQCQTMWTTYALNAQRNGLSLSELKKPVKIEGTLDFYFQNMPHIQVS